MKRTKRNSVPIKLMRKRLLAAAAKGETITYSQLARGITFDASWSPSNDSFKVDTKHWPSRDLGVVRIALNTITELIYEEHGFLISALVVNQKTKQPGRGFFKSAVKLGALDDPEDAEWFWEYQLRLVHEHYARPAGKDDDTDELSEPEGTDSFSGDDR